MTFKLIKLVIFLYGLHFVVILSEEVNHNHRILHTHIQTSHKNAEKLRFKKYPYKISLLHDSKNILTKNQKSNHN